MEGQTLVLDQSYQPIDIVDWERAITLWYEDKVEVLEEYADRIVHRGLEIFMPMIVRFTYKSKTRRRAVKFSRDNVYARDKGRCQYCRMKVPRDEITYDHVTPRKLGGVTNFNNIVICCTPCNQRKGGRTPEQAGMTLQQRPVTPDSLPARLDPRLLWRNGMPGAWSVFMTKDQRASNEYWHGELEHDDDA